MRISDWSSDVCSSDLAIIVAKVNAAEDEQVERAEAQARDLNPSATIIRGASPVVLDDPEQVRGKRVLVVDDGPDRKSVVSGKSVSVRVALGGRRILKKKTQYKHI